MNNHLADIANRCRRSLFQLALVLLTLITALCQPEMALAHKSRIDSIDPCRVPVGTDFVHFTTYTASISSGTSGKEYCEKIPHLGPTNLVFDYIGKDLRSVPVEFSVTKEPEGERVYYQAPLIVSSGTHNSTVDFSLYGEGDYLANISIEQDGQMQTASIPFQVGTAETKFSAFYKYLGLILAIVVIIVIFWPRSSTGSKA